MPGELVTNQEKLLKNVISDILPSSAELMFLVGYFYFSGFEQIYKNIDGKKLRVLVGMEAEKGIANAIKEFEQFGPAPQSRSGKEIRDGYFSSFVELFNGTSYFDSPEREEAFRLFVAKIADGTMQIRKTRDPNHAKMYLFLNKEEFSQGGAFPGTMITGSSNLTRSGLSQNFELNVIFRDATFGEGKQVFEDLWGASVLIADQTNILEVAQNLTSKIWLDKLPTPFLVYLRVLMEYFDVSGQDNIRMPSEITDDRYINLEYQSDAIKRALDVLDKHNGAMLFDVVGLGKSIIASAVAHNLGLRVVVIAPPHLRSQWEDYRREFNFSASIYGSGSMSKALSEIPSSPHLIIVDEAHKYRNEDTDAYAELHRLCRSNPGNKVLVLSATPFNNHPNDVFALVKLFQIPTKTTLRATDNLSAQFSDLAKEYEAARDAQRKGEQDASAIRQRLGVVASRIRDIIAPLMIRRSRLDLQAITEYREDMERQGIKLPHVNDPIAFEYDLGGLTDLYARTLDAIAPVDGGGFIGARYKPATYIADAASYAKALGKEFHSPDNLRQAQKNVASFMRRLLVRRFESSSAAFRATLDSMIRSSQLIKDWHDKQGKVPIYKKGDLPDPETLQSLDEGEFEEEIGAVTLDDQLSKYIEKGLELIDKKHLDPQFMVDLEKDIQLLSRVRNEWFGEGSIPDPKLEQFKSFLRKRLDEMPDRKIVVFTEFADTADYLGAQLENDFRCFKYTSSDSSAANKDKIRQNFDAGSRVRQDDYDLLVATDAISEGFNLHRAGIVVNYDIPYNPMRVVQRVGRINRINKKVFDELYIYNAFPTLIGEDETHVRQISSFKRTLHNALFGDDTRVLEKDEELLSFYQEEYRQAAGAEDEESWDVKHLNLLNNIKNHRKALYEEARLLPRRIRIGRQIPGADAGVVVFGKKGNDFAFKFAAPGGDQKFLGPVEALKLFTAEEDEVPAVTSKAFAEVYAELLAKLFRSQQEQPIERRRREAMDKLTAIIEGNMMPDEKEYLEELSRVIRDLDALPDYYVKQVAYISTDTLQQNIADLKVSVPPDYLANLIGAARNIDKDEESVILAEEIL